MLTFETLTDPEDERIGDYRALTDVELRTRWEAPHGLFIAEGELVIAGRCGPATGCGPC